VVKGFEVVIWDDNYWMGIALREARKAADRGEVPIGALAVRDGAGRKPWDDLKTLTTYPFRPFKLKIN
jgi:tRNA(Arg) A34 adenosine deaminase TadA